MAARRIRIILTRAAGRNDELAARLRAIGFDVVEAPLIRIEPIPGPPLRAEGYDWLVLTSRNAADALFERLQGPLPPVAVIGPGTAAAVRAHGVEPSLVASRSTQEGVVGEIPRPAGRVLYVGAEGARDVIVEGLGADFVPLYRTVEEPPARFPSGDLVVLASASAARSFAHVPAAVPCVCIGPVTAEEAIGLGLDVVGQAATHDLDGLVEAIRLAASRIASSRS